jgi:hypothetical protein
LVGSWFCNWARNNVRKEFADRVFAAVALELVVVLGTNSEPMPGIDSVVAVVDVVVAIMISSKG